MNLTDNPIFLTQKRLVHRGGVLAFILIAVLVGLSLLAGEIAYLSKPMDFSFTSREEAGKTFYGWAMGVEILILVLGGFNRISTVLANERKAGLWDSNRLTPLKPWQLIVGYWFGSPLREFYMSAVLAITGLIIVFLGGLSVVFWFQTQLLVLSTALMMGLAAFLAALAFKRPQGGIALVVLLFVLQAPTLGQPKYFLTDFILPTYPIASLFVNDDVIRNSFQIDYWGGLPEIFGLHIYATLLCLSLQAIIGIFLWRVAVRKTANPFRPAVFAWEIVALFAIFVFVQHGLIWGHWHGQFPQPRNRYGGDFSIMLSVVHVGTMLLALFILGAVSPQPESIRLKALRLGNKTPGAIFSSSAVPLALVLTVIYALVLLTQVVFTFSTSSTIYFIAVGNFMTFCLIFSLLLEFCRLRHKRRAIGFVVLWLFVVCILPFVLAGVFLTGDIAKFSLLAPGCIALADSQNENLNCLLGIVAGHFMIAVLLFIGWRRERKKLLAHAA